MESTPQHLDPTGLTLTLSDKVRNRTARVRQHSWRMRPYRSTERHIVIGGCPRSGTTLFRRTLDRHPSICCGPETGLFLPGRIQVAPLSARSGIPQAELSAMIRSSSSQAELIDTFAARYRGLFDKSRWAEKTPLNVRHFRWVLERFPEARLVHLIRDGRDVVCSMAEHPDWRWTKDGWVKELHQRPLETYARDWVAYTADGMRFRGDPRYHEVRYEDLAARPEETLRNVCDFLGEPFDERLLEPVQDDPRSLAGTASGGAAAIGSQLGARSGSTAVALPPDRGMISTASVGRWRTDLPAAELEKILRICGARLTELGYGD